MKLYELSEQYEELFSGFEEIEESGDEEMLQAWFDTLEGIEEEFNSTAEFLAVKIKEMKYFLDNLKAEEKAIKQKIKITENKIERLTEYIKSAMDKTGTKKIECTKATISIRNNAESVSISDEDKLIEWAKIHTPDILNYSKPTIGKTALKEMIKNGKEIPYAELQKTQSLIIK